MRVALARILLMRPDALLLDEPTNHLDIESIIWLERFLRDFEGALVMTSHDREFMNRLVTKIVEIDGGEMTTYSGNYDFYERQREIAATQQEAQYARQQAMLAKEQAFIDKFKARASHAAQVQSRVKKLEKIEKRRAAASAARCVEFDFRAAAALRRRRREARGRLARRYGARKIYDGLDLLVRRRERWCVMGVNGAGKSTLLKLVAGESQPDGGTRRRSAASVKLGVLRAARDGACSTPTRASSRRCSGAFPLATIGSMRSLAGAFGFSGDDVEKSCRVLSGGEKARLVLATMLYDPPNFLVLDEPTNHLDMATKEMLVKALADVRGHDALRLARPAVLARAVEPRPRGDGERGAPLRRRIHGVRVGTGHEAPGVN